MIHYVIYIWQIFSSVVNPSWRTYVICFHRLYNVMEFCFLKLLRLPWLDYFISIFFDSFPSYPVFEAENTENSPHLFTLIQLKSTNESAEERHFPENYFSTLYLPYYSIYKNIIWILHRIKFFSSPFQALFSSLTQPINRKNQDFLNIF